MLENQNSEYNSQPVVTNQTPKTENPPANNSLLGILAATFCVGFVFFGLLAKEILDKSYDGGGLGYLIIFVFIFPPFLVLSITCVSQIIKAKRNGEKISLSVIAKAAFLGLAGIAAIIAIPLVSRVWSSFF